MIAQRHFPVFLCLFFIVSMLTGQHFHEMWRDEYAAYGIVKHSATLADIYTRLQYEWHPGLWYGELWLLQLVWPGTDAVLHYATIINAAAGLYLLCFYAPFSTKQKLLLGLGYYFFYEYSVIARSYTLIIPLTFLWCVLMMRWRKTLRLRYLVALLLVSLLLANVSIYSAVILLPLAFALMIEQRNSRLAIMVGSSCFIIMAIVIYSLMPGEQGQSAHLPETTQEAVQQALYAGAALAGGFFPILKVLSFKIPVFQSVEISFFLLWVTLYPLFRWLRACPIAMLAFMAGMGLEFSLFFLSSNNYPLRHGGHIWILLIALLWLYRSQLPFSKIFKYLLMFQALAGMGMMILEIRTPFSDGDAVSTIIEERAGTHYIEMASPAVVGIPLMVKSDTEYPQLLADQWIDQIEWSEQGFALMRAQDDKQPGILRKRLAMMEEKARATCAAAFVVSTQPVEDVAPYRLELLHTPSAFTLSDEQLYAYQLKVVLPESCRK